MFLFIGTWNSLFLNISSYLCKMHGSYLENGSSFLHVEQKHSSLLAIYVYHFLIGKTFGVEF